MSRGPRKAESDVLPLISQYKRAFIYEYDLCSRRRCTGETSHSSCKRVENLITDGAGPQIRSQLVNNPKRNTILQN